MSGEGKSFLLEGFEMEFGSFCKLLEECPAEKFGELSHASAGHSIAWHTLHVMEWLSLAFDYQKADFAHLGWEKEEWVKAVTGTPTLSEQSDSDEIKAAFAELTKRVLTDLSAYSEADLTDNVQFPYGERQRLGVLGRQLRHVAYHRGCALEVLNNVDYLWRRKPPKFAFDRNRPKIKLSSNGPSIVEMMSEDREPRF